MVSKVSIFFGFLLIASVVVYAMAAQSVTASDASCCVYAKLAIAFGVIAAFSVVVLMYSPCPECAAPAAK